MKTRKHIFGSTLEPGFSVPCHLINILTFSGIYYIQRHDYDTHLCFEGLWETGLYVKSINLMKIFIILRQVSYSMTLILFTVFARKTCSAVSPLPEDFYVNFGGDPFTGDAPHERSMWSVFFHMGWPYGKFYAATALCAVLYTPALPKEPR